MSPENIQNHQEENHENTDWGSLQNVELATPKDVILEKIKNNLNIKKVFAAVGLAASLTAGVAGASKGVEALQEKSAISAYAEAYPDMEGNETWKEHIQDEAKTKEGRDFLKNTAEQKKQDDELVAEYMAVYGETGMGEDWVWSMIRSGNRDSLIEDIELRKASEQNKVAQSQEQTSEPSHNQVAPEEESHTSEKERRPYLNSRSVYDHSQIEVDRKWEAEQDPSRGLGEF